RWSVRVAGTDGAPIPGAGGLTLQPQVGLRALASADLILLPGMGRPRPALFAVGEALAPHLTRAQTRGALLASACTGAFVLAEAGLLDGRAATTHWRYAEELQRRHPQVDLHPERMVVEDHGVCTSGGANACFDLALYLVARIAGPALARATADALVMDTREDQRPYMHARRATGVEDVRLQRALAFMHAQYARAFTLDEAARAAGTSVRTFKRLFRDALDTTPKAYVQGLRVEAAKHLLARGGRSVEEVATAVGYTDPASFRLVFRRHVGCAPRDFRRRGR
ncbi:MAG: helix-turn-helix domain-containing protein, partial [Deltaproteobacteria bacterium]|nr:helix-turn-helix domain-containing protein [Deltaproteobacteria bacterium]